MLKVAKFIGANTDFVTAQAFLFPRYYQEGSSEPIFGLVITGEGEDVFAFIRQKVSSLEENFNAPYERITDKLRELLELLKIEFAKVENLKLTLFCARENLFYVLQMGNNFVEVLSEGERSPIVGGDFSQEKVVSGFIKPGDRILVLSSKNDSQWSDQVISEVFSSPLESIPDAEVIFAKDEQEEESEEGLAKLKNIQPVAFVLIDNEIEGQEKVAVNTPSPNTQTSESAKKINFKPNFAFILLALRKLSRQGLGLFRKTNKKILIGVCLVLLVIIAGTGGYFYYRAQEQEKNTRRDNLITLIEGSLAHADSIKDSDQKGAIEEIKKSAERLKELEGLDPKNPKVIETKGKLEQKSAEVLKIYNNFDLELFMSLDLVKENFQTKRMSFSVDKILLLDENEKSLVTVGTELKSPQILAGRTQLGDAKYASINGSNAFSYSSDKGILNVDLDTEKLSTVSEPDGNWGEIKDIFGFSDNLYALDTGKNMIWKYAPIESGFSQIQEYLQSEANLSSGNQLMIDYSVWVLTGEPDVLKFTAGNSDFYAISGVDEPVTQIDRMYVTEELDSVFLLDKSKKRILVTKKNGEYLAQYVKEELAKTDDFFVDEEGKSIYLLIENQIFKTSLRS